MPQLLLAQLARTIISLHVSGRSWLATQDSAVQTDVLPVMCVYLPAGYCLWVADYVPVQESMAGDCTGILLLSAENGSVACHLSWIGSLQAVGEQEALYRQALQATHHHSMPWADQPPRCLLQLIPQYGRISRSGTNDVALTGADLTMILQTPMAA